MNLELNLSGKEHLLVFDNQNKIDVVTTFFYPVSGDVKDYPKNKNTEKEN